MLRNTLEFIFPLLPREAPVKVIGTVKTINGIDCVCLSCQGSGETWPESSSILQEGDGVWSATRP